MRNTTIHGLLAAAMLCCSALNLFSQTTWTGGTNTDWFTAGNWTAGVPDATDDVTIANTTNGANIPGFSAAVAKSVTIGTGGLLTINTSGSLTINGFSSHPEGTGGMYNQGTVSNSGNIIFGSLASVGNYALFNKGTFDNNSGAEIHINRANATTMFNFSATFNNAGKIIIGSETSTNGAGLWNEGASFNNNSGGEIIINRTFTHGIRNLGAINNAGKITIGSVASVGYEGILNNATFNNYNSGEINIDRSSDHGVWNLGTFDNAGKITIGAVASVGNIAIKNDAPFSNSTCSALINIVSNANVTNSNQFSNAGLIIENSSNNSSISSNTGIVQNLNGGTFSVGSGNPPITLPTPLTSACCTTPIVAAIAGDLVICPGGSRVLTASGGSSYTWSTGATTASITVSTAGTYTVTVSDGLACTATATATTSILSTGTISATPNNTGPFFGGYWVCFGSTIDLNSTVPGGVWGAVKPGTVSIDPATGVVTGLTATFNTDSQTVYYKVSAPGCYLATFRTIEVRGLNPGTILGDPPPCNFPNSVVTIQLATTGASGGTWASSNPAITVSSSGLVQSMGQGTTTITYTVSDFWCTNSTTKVLTFNTFPSTTITLPASACVNSSIPISVPNAGPGATYNWSGDGIVNVNSNSTTAIPTFSGSYAVTVTPSYGCAAVGFGSVQVIAPLVCPSVFNPSNGQNAVGLNIGMLDWNDVPGAAGYLVSFGTNAPDYNNVLNGASTAISQIAIPALSANLTYGYKVTPTGNCNASGCSTVTFSTCLPSFTCPANQNVTLDRDCNMLIPDLVSELVANPGCGALSFTQDPEAGTLVPLSHNGTVQVVITPDNPNVPPCTVTLTGKDLTAPLVECKNYTANLNAAGAASITTADVFQSGSDNCGTVNQVSVSPNAFTCSNIGTNTVTLTVNDGNGNASTCTATVTVVDAIAPTVVCKNYTANLDAAGTASITTVNVFQSGTDNCGTVNQVSVSPNTFACSNKGANTVTLTVSDGNGNTSTCSATVTVVDAIAPTVTCKNITAFLGSTIPTIAVNPSQILNSASDNCGSVQPVVVSPTAYFCNDIGPHTITLTVVDGSGNTATCTGIVTIADAVKPTVTCWNNITISVTNTGSVVLPPSYLFLSGNDNCGSVVPQSVSPSTFNCSNLGTNTVVLTVNDTHGNTATCSTTVTIVDAVAPTVTCKPATVFLNASGAATITPADVYQSGNDNCSPLTLSVTPGTLTCSNLGNNTVKLTATDASGNTATCNATVTVVDVIPPTVVCKNYTATLNASGLVGVIPSLIIQSYSDNCFTTYSQAIITPLSVFNCSNLGTNTVTLTVRDYSNRQATCTAVVTVVDATAPTVVCKNYSVNLDATGNASVTTADVFQSGADNCGTVNQVSVSPNVLNCNNLGANTVTLTVNDGHGNASTCSATVTVADVTAPTVVCKNFTTALNPGGSVTIAPVSVFESGMDNCGTVNPISVSPNTFTCSNIGVNIIVLTVNDGSGNTATCTAMVTVGQYPLSVSLPACQTVYFGYTPAACATISSSVSGGTAPYSYLWSNNATTSTTQYCATSAVSPNPFSLTVTDANGCSATSGSSVINVTDIRCGNNLDKVAICHSGNTLCVAPISVTDHLSHGDYLGSCNTANPCNPAEFAPNSPGANFANSFKALNDEEVDMMLYPNPTSAWVNVHLHGFGDRDVQVLVFDGLEKLVISKKIADNTDEFQLDLSQQPSGNYYVRVISSKGSLMKQLMITK